jgi:hypothetical protein
MSEVDGNNYVFPGFFGQYESTLVLRNGGWRDCYLTKLRDVFTQELVKDRAVLTTDYQPCQVFLNGEYWGMYTLNEDYTDNHFENNYGIDNKNIVLIKRGELEEGNEDDMTLYHDMFLFITQNDMSDPAMYEGACELIDIGSFADYFAFQLYIYNEDGIFQDNNWRMWRVRSTDMATEYSDGRWRFAAYDNDFSTGIYSGANTAAFDNISSAVTQSTSKEREDNIKRYRPIELFRSLLKNDSFREEFILSLCDMRNIYFEPKHATQILNDMAAPYLQLMPDTWKRFGPDWIAYGDPAGHINSKIIDLRNFIAKRYTAVPNLVKKAFGLSGMKKLNLGINDQTLGTIQVNGRQPDFSFAFTGMYYEETTITLTAVPEDGCKFVRWDVTNGELTDTASETIQFNMTSGMTINAVFEKK